MTNAQPQVTRQDAFEWIDAHRLVAGGFLLAMLGIGLFGYLPFIRDEWPRLDLWQRAGIWIGDVTAVALVIHWMFANQGVVDLQFQTQQELSDAIRRMKWICWSLLFSLSADIGFTAAGVYVEKIANERHVRGDATVVGLEKIPWGPAVCHFKLRIQFTDTNQRVQQGLIVFTQKSGEFPSWIDFNTRRAIEQGMLPFPIRIRFDPLRPSRVWSESEPWNRGNALAYAFAIIHMFQLIVVGSISATVLFSRELRPTPVAIRLLPMLALAVESCMLALWGTLFRLRGF